MEIRFQLNYRFQGPNAPFLHAADAGYFAAEGLECTFVEGISSSLVTKPLVAGEADVGFGDVSSVMEHALRSGRDDVVCLLPIYQRTPCCLAYRGAPDSLRLADLAGNRIAGPQGDTSMRLLPLLLEKNGVAGLPHEMLVVASEERDRLMASRQVSAITCFDATLMFSMRSRGYSTDDLRFFYYADHGLDIYSSALICRGELTASRPDLTEALAQVTRRCWSDCFRDPDLGVKAVLARAPESNPQIVRDHLTWVLRHQVFPHGANSMRFDRQGTKMTTTLECAIRTVGGAAIADPLGIVDAVIK